MNRDNVKVTICPPGPMPVGELTVRPRSMYVIWDDYRPSTFGRFAFTTNQVFGCLRVPPRSTSQDQYR